MIDETELDLQALEELSVETLPEGDALGTWGTASSVGTGSCPISTAATAMTASGG